MGNKIIGVVAIVFGVVGIAVAVTMWSQNEALREAAQDAQHQMEKLRDRPLPAPVIVKKVAAPDDDAVDPKELVDARAEIARLNVVIEDKDRLIGELNTRRQADREDRRGEGRGDAQRGQGTDWAARQKAFMDRLKKEDPERYAEMQERIASFNKRLGEATAEQSDFFAELKTDNMTEEQQANHTKVQELLGKIDEINALMEGAPENGEDPNTLRRDLFTTMREVRPLLESEREVALESLGRDIGYEGEQAKEFSAYVDYIYDMTSSSMRRAWGGSSRGSSRNSDASNSTDQAPQQ